MFKINLQIIDFTFLSSTKNIIELDSDKVSYLIDVIKIKFNLLPFSYYLYYKNKKLYLSDKLSELGVKSNSEIFLINKNKKYSEPVDVNNLLELFLNSVWNIELNKDNIFSIYKFLEKNFIKKNYSTTENKINSKSYYEIHKDNFKLLNNLIKNDNYLLLKLNRNGIKNDINSINRDGYLYTEGFILKKHFDLIKKSIKEINNQIWIGKDIDFDLRDFLGFTTKNKNDLLFTISPKHTTISLKKINEDSNFFTVFIFPPENLQSIILILEKKLNKYFMNVKQITINDIKILKVGHSI